MNTAEGILILVIAVLPGFIASLFARGYDIEPSKRSPTESIAFLLHFAVYVHIISITLFALIDLRYSLQLLEIIERGLQQYFVSEPLRGSLVYGGYLICILLLSPLIGTYNLPRRIPDGIFELFRFARIAPKPSLVIEPVWYGAFRLRRQEAEKDSVWVRIRMKNGDIYEGSLVSYPIVSDEMKDKDFLIDNAYYYPKGDKEQVQVLNRETVEGFGGVLLNTHDVDSIEFRYYNISDL